MEGGKGGKEGGREANPAENGGKKPKGERKGKGGDSRRWRGRF